MTTDKTDPCDLPKEQLIKLAQYEHEKARYCVECDGYAISGERLCVACKAATVETIHRCPPIGSGLMPCCGKTPFEVPRTDRLTEDESLVTCRRAA